MSSFIDTLKAIDTDILVFINSKNSPFWDEVMITISGKFTWIPMYLLFAVLIIRDYRKSAWLVILFGIIAVVLSDQAANLIKDHVMRYRPSHNGLLTGALHYYSDQGKDPYMGGQYGFPSNHAANAASIATYLILLFRNKWVTLGLMVYVFLICYSRVYLGVHYPFDVFCGCLLGLFTGSLAHKTCMLLQRGTSMTDN